MAVGAVAMFILCGVALLVTAAVMVKQQGRAEAGYPASALCPVAGDEGVTSRLRPIRQKFGVPSMAAAVVTSEGVQFMGVVGVRKRDTQIPVALEDLWHLGSDTKAMTSTLIARLVEKDLLKWDTKVGDVFPDLPRMQPELRKVTLLHLLCHRAGLPADLELSKYLGENVVALRLKAVREELAKKPGHAPGSAFEYSNLGYIVSGAVVEKVTGESWETAMTREVFEPLQMKATGFGGTGGAGKIDQPWPHSAGGTPTSGNGPTVDNPPVMGPAGRVHCSMRDWARFIQDQLRGARGQAGLLKAESYQKLHTPPFGGDYALGWGTASRDWGGGKVLQHTGDNTLNCANVWIAPQRDFAILVCVNQGGEVAFRATDEAVASLIKLHDEKMVAK